MMGLILVGLVGVLVVVGGTPLVLWTLSMETLRERGAAQHTMSAGIASPVSCRLGHRAVVAMNARCTDACRPVAHQNDEEGDGPLSLREPFAIGA